MPCRHLQWNLISQSALSIEKKCILSNREIRINEVQTIEMVNITAPEREHSSLYVAFELKNPLFRAQLIASPFPSNTRSDSLKILL